MPTFSGIQLGHKTWILTVTTHSSPLSRMG